MNSCIIISIFATSITTKHMETLRLKEINKFCSINMSDTDSYRTDKYGAKYSVDFKILLRLPYDFVEYNVNKGTEIIANGAFDHFEVNVDHDNNVDYSCAHLQKLYLPSSVKYITDQAFGEDGYRLDEIRVESNPDYYKLLLKKFADKIVKREQYDKVIFHDKKFPYNTVYFDIYGGAYTKDGKWLASLEHLSPNIPSYQVMDGVQNIGAGSAEYCTNVHEVIIPPGVNHIYERAFMYSSLSIISLPKSLREIKEYAFQGCDEIVYLDIPEGVRVIDDYAFNQCSKLEMVNLPASLIHIGYEAFANNKSLKEVKFDGIPAFMLDNPLQYSDIHHLIFDCKCFYNCPLLQHIYIPKGGSTIFEILLPDYVDKFKEQ